MIKPDTKIGSCERDSLRATADLILGRTNAIATRPAKDRALELARIVLREAPSFGGHEMRDREIIEALKREQIGPATFRKALSVARRELVKKPTATSSKRGKPSAGKADSLISAAAPSLPTSTPASSIAPATDRTLL